MKKTAIKNCETQYRNKKKHIVIDTPCSVSDMESFLHIVANEGHWHDAMVHGDNGKIVIEFEVDQT